MKKIILIVIILLAVIGGLYFYNQKIKKSAPAVTNNVNQRVGLHVVDDNTLTGWLKRKKTVECEVTTGSGVIKMMVKNDKVRIEGIPYAFGQSGSQPNGYSLTDEDWVYLWSGSEGTKFNLTEVQASLTEEQKNKTAAYSWEQSAIVWESENKYDCQEKKLADSLFIPPTEINFVDMTETLETAQAAAEKARGNLAPGQNLNQEDIEEQMEKIKESTPVPE